VSNTVFKSPIVIAFNRWLITERGKNALDQSILKERYHQVYLQNRLWHAFMAGVDAGQVTAKVVVGRQSKLKQSARMLKRGHGFSVRERLLQAAVQLPGAIFDYPMLKAKCFELFPQEQSQIETGFYVSVSACLKRKEFHRVPGGFSLQPPAAKTTPQTS